jgi:hypothetical protein
LVVPVIPVVVVVDDDDVVVSDLTSPCADFEGEEEPDRQAASMSRAATATMHARFIMLFLSPVRTVRNQALTISGSFRR